MKAFIFSFLLCLSLFAEEYKFEMKGVKASLISEYKAIQPGQKFTLALYLQHFDDFHTYWKNPGLVGFATNLQWKLPEGFEAGEIQWQVPERSKMLKFNCHAYKGDTYLLIDIQAPENIPEKFKLEAKVGGMSCSIKECCKIGFMDVFIELQKSTKPILDVEGSMRIKAAKDKLPKINNTYEVESSIKDKWLTLNVKGDKLPEIKDIYFYSNENITDTEAEQQSSVQANQLQLKVKLNNYVEDNLAKISGLIYSKNSWGESNYLPFESVLKKPGKPGRKNSVIDND